MRGILFVSIFTLLSASGIRGAEQGSRDSTGPAERFLIYLTDSSLRANDILPKAAEWTDTHTAMTIESIRFARTPGQTKELYALLRDRTKQDLASQWKSWTTWFWRQDVELDPGYAKFKSRLYRAIDPRFAKYFSEERDSLIRLDEIVWGGVRQDGIPPLRDPEMLPARNADYLDDDNVVFGVKINGDARAYPKRILAWHEMFVDSVGGVPVCGVYCTLCGSMIIYETDVSGTRHAMGTSGFLYRSNKLMYDKATQSLWSTMTGEPVVGPLVGKGITLPRGSVVTTTWGEWRKRHPDTKVLSLNTGHRRDYAEGAAYRDYFATDELMFPVPHLDQSLKNKSEVLGLLLPDSRSARLSPNRPLAISAEFLAKNPLYHSKANSVSFVVLTDPSGANRVYRRQAGQEFTGWDGEGTVYDNSGGIWKVTESALTGPENTKLERLPSHRAFWFGWHAAFPETVLTE